ncbi:RING finger protein 212B-like [Lampris incognitus]|uniref:RING finger protein 212B-like n=1 Tax=Lampris incognitus TaxID=2546036 RepID=UPI0024B4D2A9|nr:RING finger protein 212B-like [Lampris incognitus]
MNWVVTVLGFNTNGGRLISAEEGILSDSKQRQELEMDWFHCNHCFRRKGQNFSVSSCGHIFCEGCIKPKHCSICGSSCSYLPITDQMKPEEKMFFRDPVELIQSRLEHIKKIALFQHTQKARITAYFKHKSVELEMRLKEVTNESYR